MFNLINHFWKEYCVPSILYSFKQVPKLSDGEIKKALIAHGNDKPYDLIDLKGRLIVEDCIANRHNMINTYYSLYNDDNPGPLWVTDKNLITRELIERVIFQCNGDDAMIRQTLSGKVQNPVYTLTSCRLQLEPKF